MSTTKLAEALRLGREGAPPTEAERLLFEEWMRGHCWALCATWNGTQYVHEAEAGGDLYPPAMNTRQLFAAWRDRAALASYEAQAEAKPAPMLNGLTEAETSQSASVAGLAKPAPDYDAEYNLVVAQRDWAFKQIGAKPSPADLCERICAAIVAEDTKSMDEAGYMLDSNDCIAIVREQFAAAPAAPAPTVKDSLTPAPAGFVLVPLVPTQQMLDAALTADEQALEHDGENACPLDIYNAMLAAAPAAPALEPLSNEQNKRMKPVCAD
ncbi:MAG: hypothetical protein ACOVN9_09660, partial [Inhella sp.]